MLILASCLVSCRSPGKGKVQLHVFHADSLIIPFEQIKKDFEKQNPGIDVLLDGHGSIQVIRAVTELNQDVDVAAVADSQLLRLLMYDTAMKNGNGPYADWCIEFATNAVGIAYTEISRYSDEITPGNWFDIMSRPEVKIGLADPRIDSLGYRALMSLELANGYYQQGNIFNQVLDKAFIQPLDVSISNGIAAITVPQLLKPAQSRIVLRSYSLQITALLESGDVDYSFEYESVARQRGLKFLELPSALNLSSADYASQYRQVKVNLDFQRFASVNPQFNGSPILYGITIPRNALHPYEASMFIQYLLGKEGQTILSRNYQPPLIPAVTDNNAKMPADLQPFVK
jgi:molybdate/tungstate transport system substrate-binding protein